ncbi:hypothetical protein YN1_8520 [Nanoarchaeota archaeon]
MDATGILDLRKSILIYIIALIFIFLDFLLLFGLGKYLPILAIIGIFSIPIYLILSLLSIIFIVNGFNKIGDRFDKARLGKIGSYLAPILVGYIFLGLSFLSLGNAIKNYKVKIGGIIFIFPPIGFIGAILIYLGLTEVARQIKLI